MDYNKIYDIAMQLGEIALNLKDISALKDARNTNRYEISTPGASYTTTKESEISVMKKALETIENNEVLELLHLITEISDLVLEKKEEIAEDKDADSTSFKLITSKNFGILLNPDSYNSNYSHKIMTVDYSDNVREAVFESIEAMISFIRDNFINSDYSIKKYKKIMIYQKDTLGVNYLRYLICNPDE